MRLIADIAISQTNGNKQQWLTTCTHH